MLAKYLWLHLAQFHKRGQDSFGLVQSLDRRLCYTKKVLLDSSVERPDRIETCNQEEPLLEHSDTRLLAGTKLLPLQNCSTSSIHDLTDILVTDCLEMFAPQTHKLEWPTKHPVFLQVLQRFCETDRQQCFEPRVTARIAVLAISNCARILFSSNMSRLIL